MNGSTFIDEADLHALVDGELDSERRRKVEDHLLQHPEDAALVEGWRRQNAALRAAFEPVALETPPLSLREAAARPHSQTGTQQGPIETGAVHWGRPGAPRLARTREEVQAGRRRQSMASMLITLLAGAGVAAAAFVAISGRRDASAVVASAPGYAFRAGLTYATYATDSKPVELDAGRRPDLAAWLQERVGFSRVPELGDAGLKLLGGRVAPGVAAPAGFLVYERADGGRVALYFERADTMSPAEGAHTPPNLTAIEWRANGYAFVLVGQLSTEAMQATAERAAASVAAPLK